MTLPLSVRLDRWIRHNANETKKLREIWGLTALIVATLGFIATPPETNGATVGALTVICLTWWLSLLSWDIGRSAIRKRSDYLLDQGTQE